MPIVSFFCPFCPFLSILSIFHSKHFYLLSILSILSTTSQFSNLFILCTTSQFLVLFVILEFMFCEFKFFFGCVLVVYVSLLFGFAVCVWYIVPKSLFWELFLQS
jgi:hypothetical protein